jgi:hypothetical protein
MSIMEGNFQIFYQIFNHQNGIFSYGIDPFSVMGIRKIINSLPLRRKIASQFSSSAYVRIRKLNQYCQYGNI